ncbi:MAG: hypothetical protein LUG13_05350 [Oscillospiraceae bacterium]|nr:hypothetical protein [Oscillospiraceae bacterium]
MTIDLEKYQAPMPYPKVKDLQPEKNLTALLQSGYSGEGSELTSLLQYAQHSLRCKRRFGEISHVMRGIFYVETYHMELLGKCITRLGGEAQYILCLQEHEIFWQASLVEYSGSAAEMLLADIRGEKGAVEYYQNTAEQVCQPELKALLLRLAEDEKLHVRILTDLYRKYFC